MGWKSKSGTISTKRWKRSTTTASIPPAPWTNTAPRATRSRRSLSCAPLAEEGNPAPGLVQLGEIQKAYPGVPVIVWSTRTEPSLRQTCLEDYHCAAYYTGTLLDAPTELPALLAQALG